jgi:O-antigen/teichoic acid export membrane protein
MNKNSVSDRVSRSSSNTSTLVESLDPALNPGAAGDLDQAGQKSFDSAKHPAEDDFANQAAPQDLKRKTARGAFASTCGQGANLVIRIGAMVVLARLLTPEDFGLVAMATACTGFLALFQDVGLSMATVQRQLITRAQTSTLFWINLSVGAILTALCAAVSPFLVAFYHEPRLIWVTVMTGVCFVLGGAAAQHRAVLMRELRFGTLAGIDIFSLVVSVALAIGMAAAGKGYWALVAMTICGSIVSAACAWIAGGWIPGPPQRGAGVRSMVKYGGTLTLNSLIVYIAYNADKVLLGRFWGAELLGIYGRAYQLINLPTQNLNSTIGVVAFPALSRLQNDPERLKSYFLKGYGLFLALVMPITMACALFAEDITRVFLGSKWGAAVPVFRLLAPTIVAFALINPFGWFMQATGRAARSLKMAFLVAPVVIIGYVVGLNSGPTGVAAGFSSSMMLLVVPVIFWATRGTTITMADTFKVVMRPFLAAAIGAGAALAAWPWICLLNLPLLRLVAANVVLFSVYGLVLWFAMGQKALYLGVLREIGAWPSKGGSKSECSSRDGHKRSSQAIGKE